MKTEREVTQSQARRRYQITVSVNYLIGLYHTPQNGMIRLIIFVYFIRPLFSGQISPSPNIYFISPIMHPDRPAILCLSTLSHPPTEQITSEAQITQGLTARVFIEGKSKAVLRQFQVEKRTRPLVPPLEKRL